MSPRKPLPPEKRAGYDGRKIFAFCKNVQSRREALGISQKAVADMLGIPQQRISEIEGGAFPDNPDRILALARALETDPNTLLGFTEDM
jgi:transcriptional regulator with XRE-family HTH domain